MRRPRRTHPAAFKGKVPFTAANGEPTPAQLAELFDVHPKQIARWKSEQRARAVSVFARASDKRELGLGVTALHARIGQRGLEIDFLEHAIGRGR